MLDKQMTTLLIHMNLLNKKKLEYSSSFVTIIIIVRTTKSEVWHVVLMSFKYAQPLCNLLQLEWCT